MRTQPLHGGHAALLNLALEQCDVIIIGFGSCQESRTLSNPYDLEERKEMFRIITTNSPKLRMIPMPDLGPCTKKEWIDFVYKTIDDAGEPKPTHYYSGCMDDAKWYTDVGMEVVICDRFMGQWANVSATKIRESIIAKSDYWKTQVPPELHVYVESKFPQQLRGIDPTQVVVVKKDVEMII